MKFELHQRVDDPAKRPEVFAQYIAAFALGVEQLLNAPEEVLSLERPAQHYLKLTEDLSAMAALIDPKRQINIADESAMRIFRSKLIALFLNCTQTEPRRIPPELRQTRWSEREIVTPIEVETLVIHYGLRNAAILTWSQKAKAIGLSAPSGINYHRREGLYKLSMPKNFNFLRDDAR